MVVTRGGTISRVPNVKITGNSFSWTSMGTVGLAA